MVIDADEGPKLDLHIDPLPADPFSLGPVAPDYTRCDPVAYRRDIDYGPSNSRAEMTVIEIKHPNIPSAFCRQISGSLYAGL